MDDIRNIDFLGIKVSILTREELIEKIIEFASSGKRRFITYLNAHCVNTAFADPEYRKVINVSDIVHADGISIFWASRLFGKHLPERVNIFDFQERIFVEIAKRNISVYFLGGKESIAQQAVKNLQARFPCVRVLGVSGGYFSDNDEEEIISKINDLKPNILIVGMGVPKQEKWVYAHLSKLNVNLCWIAGSAMFDNLSGALKNPPLWLSHIGLQWLYRLFQEPRRLWRRYIIGNLIFIYHVFAWKMKSVFSDR